MRSIEWTGEELVLLDQTKLPTEEVYIRCTDWREVAEAIKMLRVRGAPAIGVAAAYGLILAAKEAQATVLHEARPLEDRAVGEKSLFLDFANELRSARPTAINLAWAIDRVVTNIVVPAESITAALPLIEAEAQAIEHEDLQLNTRMAKAGITLFEGQQGIRILTHCNAGALATAGVGTALGVVRELHKVGKLERVYADETRPLLQGARLTAFELHEDGIPVTLLTDNMAAYAMQQGLIDAVIVGADRITTKGDVANKIGTYGVALLAKAHNIPFYVAAPYSTFDFTLENGADIPIEMRAPEEVTHFSGVQTAPKGIEVLNPAFDVTPHELVTAIITEEGVLKPPFTVSIDKLKQLTTDI
ncbi:S-methyl-5-thioribose-1-phosphate isomerase [uncultured Veillonella sp.]|uniref:S-methyl-5-thioribose-1-phosphate isomerase n=1 Tax=uncultured Veillonella sp. TaxID=159268 RepID=UPI0026219BD2|nr:S-methyl-5-thioribose-1-phosphate isomerase [uncultured Veillonella sp.]